MSKEPVAEDEKNRAVSLTELYRQKFPEYDFKDEWFESFGKPERSAVWFIMADIGTGKTTFVCMLSKYLSKFGLVDYDSIEEGKSASLREAMKRVGLEPGYRRVRILNKMYTAELIKRLEKHKSADIVVIDTLQHSDLTKRDYLLLKKKFPNKTLIIISHKDGKKPEGSLAKFIHQDAGLKIDLEGFVAFPKTRYKTGTPKPFIIYDKGARDYWGVDFLNGFKNKFKQQ